MGESGWQLHLAFGNDDCFHLQSVRGELSHIAFDSARVLDECLRVVNKEDQGLAVDVVLVCVGVCQPTEKRVSSSSSF
jgi:hypothetical protein